MTISGKHYWEGGYWYLTPSLFWNGTSGEFDSNGKPPLYRHDIIRKCRICKIWDDTYKLKHNKKADWNPKK